MLRIITFALVLEALALGGPLLNQLVIDEVLVAADRNLLSLIIIGLLLLSFTQMLLSLACQWASITLSVNFNMQWTAKQIWEYLAFGNLYNRQLKLSFWPVVVV